MDITAIEYAKEIFRKRALYRAFNLVVSDVTGTFYVSSSVQQIEVERLHPGRLYALTNGYLHDSWDKTSVGKYFIETALVNELKVCARPALSPTDFGSVPLIPIQELDAATVQAVANKLADIMATHTPLADPTHGRRSLPAMFLSAIFVRPTVVLRRPLYQLVFLTRQFILEVLGMYLWVLQWLVDAVLATGWGGRGGGGRAGSGETRTLWHRCLRWLYSTVEIALYQPASYVRLRNGTDWLMPNVDMFGTRTTTVIVHVPLRSPEPDDDPESSMRASAATDAADDGVSTAASQPSCSPATTKEAAYYILERDLDTQRMVWSDAVYTNLATPRAPTSISTTSSTARS